MEMFTPYADLLTPLMVDQVEKYIDYWRMSSWSITFCFVLRVFRDLVVGNTRWTVKNKKVKAS